MSHSTRSFILAFGTALLFVFILFIESQILLRIYGAGNIPTITFFAVIIPTSIIFRLGLYKVFDWLDY